LLQKKLGRTDTRVSAIGQGAGLGGYSDSSGSYDDFAPVIRAGIDAGLTFIDTAPAYGHGESERIVGRALDGIRDKVVLATKVSPEDTTADGVVRSAEASLSRLRTDVIDLFHIHWSNPTVPIGETMEGMGRLVEQGKIRHIGVSNFSLNELKDARAALTSSPITSLQVEYNLFDRSIEDVMVPYCLDHGISIIAYSPLHRGRVVGGLDQKSVLDRIAGRHDATTAQVALAWLVSRPSVVAIPSTTRPARIIENAGAMALELTPEEKDEIDRVCSLQQRQIPTDRVRPAIDDSRPAFRTLQEALDNTLNVTPSPRQLAEQIRSGDFLKPVRLVPADDNVDEFEVLEGRLRYWAWVIAFDGKKPVPALIDETS
jgi:aryl-alcohol dehydrogenase-like predicted oxidoreductase